MNSVLTPESEKSESPKNPVRRNASAKDRVEIHPPFGGPMRDP